MRFSSRLRQARLGRNRFAMKPSAEPLVQVEPQKASRHTWMDMSRGLAVLLVVLVHAGSIYNDIGGFAVPGWIAALDRAFAPYRIPFLVFLSGIFLHRSLAKGLEKFSVGKVRNLLWPFLLWTLIVVAAATGPQGWLDWRVWIVGGPTLWYLSFLLIFYVVGLVFARFPALVLCVYALALSMIAPDETRYGERLLVLMSYFFVGAYAGQNLARFHEIISDRRTLLLLPVMIGVSAYFTTQTTDFKYTPYVAPLVLACIVCMSSIMNAAVGSRFAPIFQFAGRNSLVYYVVHPPIYFALYSALFGRGITNPYVCISIALPLAIGTATLLAHARSHSRAVNYLFEGPDIRLGPSIAKLAGWLERLLIPRGLLHRKA